MLVTILNLISFWCSVNPLPSLVKFWCSVLFCNGKCLLFFTIIELSSLGGGCKLSQDLCLGTTQGAACGVTRGPCDYMQTIKIGLVWKLLLFSLLSSKGPGCHFAVLLLSLKMLDWLVILTWYTWIKGWAEGPTFYFSHQTLVF